MDAKWLYEIIVLAPPLLLSLTVHEFAHARTALAFGDPTAKMMGRVSLNPLVHLDPIGTLVLLVTRMIGWARPVPVNPMNLHPRRLGDAMVSLAGPMSNLALAIVCGLLLRVLVHVGWKLPESFAKAATLLLLYTMVANVGLCVFNLIPLFPLDGHHIVREMLPPDKHGRFMDWQLRHGRIILMVLIFAPILLETVTGRETFNPIGFLFRHALAVMMRIVGL